MQIPSERFPEGWDEGGRKGGETTAKNERLETGGNEIGRPVANPISNSSSPARPLIGRITFGRCRPRRKKNPNFPLLNYLGDSSRPFETRGLANAYYAKVAI